MSIWDRIKNEPVMIKELANAIILLLTAFGVTVTEGQTQAILAVIAAVILILTGVPVRQSVTPNPTVDKRIQATRDALQRRQP